LFAGSVIYMTMKPLKIALKFLDTFYHEDDPELLRELVHTDLSFEGPMYEFSSAEDYIESLKQVPPRDMEYRIIKSFGDDNSVCLVYEFSKPGVRTTMVQLFDIDVGKIRRIRLVFDTAALESHEVILASQVDELGNDDVLRLKVFSEFRTVDNRNYQPLNEATAGRLPGRYETGYLGVNNEPPGVWEDIEFRADGSVVPDNHINHWEYRGDNIVVLHYPYEGMPDFHLEAGVEQQPHYVFVEENGQSLIISNSDGSVKSLYERQR